ncbi:MAG: hypothetical protein ACRYGF_07195 [Janthinobacterium lividum]
MNFLEIAVNKQWNKTDQVEDPWKMLFSAGKEARAKQIPFDTQRAEPWKRGWVVADIRLGMLEEREP